MLKVNIDGIEAEVQNGTSVIEAANGLGIYSVSYEVSNLPSTELVAPINRVTLPGFAKMKDNDEILVSYLRLMGMITLLILPVGVGIAAVAEPLVPKPFESV